ncbi:aspartate/glutamate racemase family protein [Aeromicrobium piscarium]|uniref:Hydantoin racemase n=1 Tax=Aeromicrobium piscarium TaxID=2590901 RepID=A0A554S873_9ACTN|nr:aspartate/glutamate racemase family protein [Aeromicrobium piscarium]TSD62558.1 hydantoin racemase [Aeromicrobium piscarium]
MMRLLAVTPIDVSDEEVGRRQARYDRLCPPGLSIELRNIGTAAPTALEDAAAITASEEAMIRYFASVDPAGFDGFLPDCVLDPVVDHADALPLPVYGIGRATAHYLRGLGLTVGAVARTAAIAAELDRRLGVYGVPAAPTAVMHLSVEDIAKDEIWAAAVEKTMGSLGVQAVINACSAVDVTTTGQSAALVDPTAVALRMIAMLPEVAA